MLSCLREKAVEGMSEKRRIHTLAVEQMAMRIGAIYAPDKINVLRAAALLHDVTKEIKLNGQLEMCEKYNYQKDISCIILSLYYNFINETPIRGFDHLHLGNKNSKYRVNSLTINELPRHLSWTDSAFSEKRFRDILDIVVGFKNIKLDKIKNMSMFEKIREEIKNGKIVKVKKPDGTYVWKKVKK